MNDDDFLIEAGKSIQLLDTINRSEYWPSRLPSPLDQGIGDVCDLYLEATSLQRQVFMSGLSARSVIVLSDYSIRMAMASVRKNSEILLQRGLVALVIYLDWPWTDPRDSFFSELVMIHHSAVKLGADLDHLFHIAAQVAIRQSTRDLVYPPRGNTSGGALLNHVWWAETEGPAGLIYYLRGQPIPEGHLISAEKT
jgi:hypothetical protein